MMNLKYDTKNNCCQFYKLQENKNNNKFVGERCTMIDWGSFTKSTLEVIISCKRRLHR